MGRRRAAGHRERAAGQARLVRHVPATGAVGRLSGLQRTVLCAGAVSERRAIPQLGLARAVPRQRRAGRARLVCAPENRRNAGLSGGHRTQGTREGADRRRCFRNTGCRPCSARWRWWSATRCSTSRRRFRCRTASRCCIFRAPTFLGLLCIAVVFMALATPLSAWASDRYGRKPVLIVGIIAAILSGFTMAPLLGSGQTPLVLLFLVDRTVPDGRDLRADGRAAAGAVPDQRALYRRGCVV